MLGQSLLKGSRMARATWRRNFGSLPLQISEEVRQALNDKVPVVSLESTIITHGLPYPENLSMAREVESVIRDNGCVPATMAFLQGVPMVGLEERHLEQLASSKKVHKTSRRDIGYVMASKIDGGTTISSTMILSKLAGISIFATGGLGGVHKNGESTMDVSADLDELSKTEVMVVCSGPKAILDIDRTTEYLETKGVPLLTYNPKNKSKVFVPGFYCEESNTVSPFAFNDFKTPASVFHNGYKMQLGNGYVVCIPPPDHLALDKDFIYSVIDEAQAEAEKLDIRGKEVTPFLLGKINAETGGKSVKSNIGFVLNNAKCASEIAKELNSLQNESTPKVQYQPSTKLTNPTAAPLANAADHCRAVVIGSIAVDLTCILKPGYELYDSNPGVSEQSVGGVGYNVALAASFTSRETDPITTGLRLISVVGDDAAATKIRTELHSKQMDDSGLFVNEKANTAQYISMHADDGSLLVACADMDIAEQLPLEHVRDQLSRARPAFALMDSNVSSDVMNTVLGQSEALGFQVVLEPTSVIKASRIAETGIRPWPENQVSMATPTVQELATMYWAFEKAKKFDDLDNWFNVVDGLGLDSVFREELARKATKVPALNDLTKEGVFQMAFKLLPYIPCLVVKDGVNGVVVVQLVTNAHELNDKVSGSASFTSVTKRGREFYDEANRQKKLGVVVQHFPIPQMLNSEDIKNVTGAGDSLMGYLFNKLANDVDFLGEFGSTRDQVFRNAQVAAGASLLCDDAINIDAIAKIQ